MMNKVLPLAAVAEAATGAVILADPLLVGRLLLGVELAVSAISVARVAGIALIALAVACWPGPAKRGMLLYSASVALFLAYLGLFTPDAGILLWPAVGVHVLLSAALARSMTWPNTAQKGVSDW